jgi:hypothetical protein
MKKIINTRAAQTALTVAIVLGVLTPFVGQLWPAMLAIWIGWAIVTPLSIRTEVRHAD